VMADLLPLGVRRIHLGDLVSDMTLSSASPIVSDAAPKLAGASASDPTFAAPTNGRVRVASPPGAPLDPAWDKPVWFLAPNPAVANSRAGNEEPKRIDPPMLNALEQIFEGVIEITTYANRGNDDATSSEAFGIPSPSLAELVP